MSYINILGSVWIQLKIEKHCSKIIFKCVNSIVGPIFNEKVDKKWYLWVHKQCTNALFTVEKVNLYGWKLKKKKKKKAEMCFAPRRGRKTHKPNIALEFILEKCYLNNIFTPTFRWQVVTGFKLGPPLSSLYIYIYIYILIEACYLWFVMKLIWKCCWLNITFYFDL